MKDKYIYLQKTIKRHPGIKIEEIMSVHFALKKIIEKQKRKSTQKILK